MENFKSEFKGISKCFYENFVVLNPDKCQFMVIGDPNYTCKILHVMVRQQNIGKKKHVRRNN